ncbi:hypothetical protein [Leucobacter sp. G161]|nr:hypothetical protein [Leucobacter sp. G161]
MRYEPLAAMENQALAVSDRDAAILKASRMGLLEQPDPGKR